ncbi:MAG: hypothetical protein SO099_03445 [Ruthenibacterium lactatiformans]|jgi:hypothetical protein|nr:hypothetical protein [Ruthenibacterium lactatiformans]MDY4944150.1 hypothetical protein [Ruthenibacterium lactatiformans]
MKTIVSLALVGLMSISTLLPALAAQETENISIPESSGISESMAQDESSVSGSGSLADGNATSDSSSTADESSAPESGSNAGADVSQPESDSMPVESDSSTSVGSKAETGSSLPVSESTVSDETESVPDSETTESDANAEDSSGVTAATADEQTIPVTVSEEYALLLATNQADSMMGHAGMERSDACTQPAASFALADYAAETEDESYCLLWEAMNAEFEQLGAQGYPAARCVYADDTLMVYV